MYSSSRIISVDSSGTVYKRDQYPYKETDFLKKCNAYSQHKILLERMLIESHLSYVNLRLGNVYGGKTPEQIIHGAINTWVYNLRQHKRIELTSPLVTFQGYSYIKDLSNALDKIFNSDVSKSIFNLAYGRPVTLGTILHRLRTHLSTLNLVEATKVIYDNYVLNTDLITSTINWKPKYYIKLGVRDCISVNTNKQLC